MQMEYAATEIADMGRRILRMPKAADVRVETIARGGSTRTYYRIAFGGMEANACAEEEARHSSPRPSPGADRRHRVKSAILMLYDTSHQENNHYASVAGFLGEIGVGAPLILYHEPPKGCIILEDLGTEDLWSFRDAPWETRRAYYVKTLSAIRKLHDFPLEEVPARGVPLMESFGSELYRWEREYFLEHFVRGYCRIELRHTEAESLETELAALADMLATQAPCLIHRDFQSQNVLIRDGEPKLIDFQGMRMGSPFYDLGSLLYDPYVHFTDSQRRELLHHYYSLTHKDQRWSLFVTSFRLASAQRLMQALGAYSFLGLKRGKRDFLLHIPNGLRNLLDISESSKRLKQLAELCRRCLERP